MSESLSFPIAGYEVRIKKHTAASAGAPTILALHGFSGCGNDFWALRDQPGMDRYNWICPDFPGHGESDSPEVLDPYLLPATISLIDAARQMAPDPAKVLLLAYSMGGRLALHYLRHAKPMPALLIGTSPGLASARERANRRKADQKWIRLLSGPDPMEQFSVAWERQSLMEPQTRLPEPLGSCIARRRRSNNPTGLIHSLLGSGTGAIPSLWSSLAGFPPLTLAHGMADRKFGNIAEKMARLNPHFTVVEIPGAGHAAHLEQPGELARILVQLADEFPA